MLSREGGREGEKYLQQTREVMQEGRWIGKSGEDNLCGVGSQGGCVGEYVIRGESKGNHIETGAKEGVSR